MPDKRKNRPSITDIAKELGVSVMTVSNALRGNHHVSEATRKKVLKTAERMGYRPDPLVSHLMHHLRSRRIKHTQANLGVLMLNDDHYVQRILTGVRSRAERLGYVVDKIAVEPYMKNPDGFTRMLQARGITGLLLPPCRVPQSLMQMLDWTKFAAVSMSYSVIEPRFHRVVPHTFHNAMLILRKLREYGYRRALFAIGGAIETRANHALAGAKGWAAHEWGEPFLPPFVLADGLKGIAPWFRRHQPDALIVMDPGEVENILRPELGPEILSQIGVAVVDHWPGSDVAGIDQKPALIGSTAVDLLVAKLHHQEFGPPEDPVVSMVEGEWREGNTVRWVGAAKPS